MHHLYCASVSTHNDWRSCFKGCCGLANCVNNNNNNGKTEILTPCRSETPKNIEITGVGLMGVGTAGASQWLMGCHMANFICHKPNNRFCRERNELMDAALWLGDAVWTQRYLKTDRLLSTIRQQKSAVWHTHHILSLPVEHQINKTNDI